MGITPQQFEQMQSRARRPRGVASPAVPGGGEVVGATTVRHEIILGVDPSLRGTGYGVIRVGRPHPTAMASGTIRCPAGWERSRCLVRIAEVLREVVRAHRPTVCAMEGLFFAQNLQTALLMGEARGAGLVAVAESGLDIYEIAPRRVKQAIVGFGGAQKLAVATMVQRLLRLAELPEADAADALALALAYAHENGRYALTPRRRL